MKPIKKTCPICKQEFLNPWWMEKRGCGITCSKECRNIRRGQHPQKHWFKKGYIPRNKGRPLSDEVREKISRSLQGDKNPNWKGGINLLKRATRNTAELARWKRLVFKRDGHTCVRCGSSEKPQAHHILSFTDYPDRRTDLDNGITWCFECHSEHHGFPVGRIAKSHT